MSNWYWEFGIVCTMHFQLSDRQKMTTAVSLTTLILLITSVTVVGIVCRCREEPPLPFSELQLNITDVNNPYCVNGTAIRVAPQFQIILCQVPQNGRRHTTFNLRRIRQDGMPSIKGLILTHKEWTSMLETGNRTFFLPWQHRRNISRFSRFTTCLDL